MTDQNSTSDPLDRLRDLRPDAITLEHEWPAAERGMMLHDLQNDRLARRARFVPPTRRGRRRVGLGVALAAGAAAAVAIGVVLPDGSPGGPQSAAAAELQRLAVLAGEHGSEVGADQYAFRATVEEQTADDLSVPPPPGETRVGTVNRRPEQDTYRSPSGVTYKRTAGAVCLTRDAYTGGSAEDGRYENLTGDQLAVLPTDPDALAEFFDTHREGDNRGTRNRFLAVGDVLRSGLASPQLRAAGLHVLADTDGLVVLKGVPDGRGRPATTVALRYGDGTVETLFFDPSTSVLLEEQQTSGTSHYSGIVLASGVVDRLPVLPRC